MGRRITSLILALSLMFSLLVTVSPSAGAYEYVPEPSEAVSFFGQIESYFRTLTGKPFPATSLVDRLVLPYRGECTMAQLECARDHYNDWYVSALRTVDYQNLNTSPVAVITYVLSDGIYRLCDNDTSLMIVDSYGHFPYVLDSSVSQGTADPNANGAQVPAIPSISHNHWVGERSLSNKAVIIDFRYLSECVVDLNAEGYTCSVQQQRVNGALLYVIKDNGRQVYCNSNNEPFASTTTDSATDIKYDYIVNDGSTTINDSQIIDVADGILNVINENGERKELHIDNLTFDFDNRQYTVNAYDYTYNTENNFYTYNYYTYNVSYTYNYTYITYIGASAEYIPEDYTLFYELPDGRTSADLTAEEIAGLSLDFDVVNYDRTYTDRNTYSLYHLDGNTDDDSYFGDKTSFTWNAGASITYLEHAGFDGCLYLDELAHKFTIDTTCNINHVNDWTLEFRLYGCRGNVYTPSSGGNNVPSANNYVKLVTGDRLMYPTGNDARNYNYLFVWDGQNYYFPNKAFHNKSLSSGSDWRKGDIPAGSWIDVCIVRIDKVFQFYINGLLVATSSSEFISAGTSDSASFEFNFSTADGGYKYIDEIRFVDFAVYDRSFTPSPVPHDTNNVFVLPDGTELDPLTIAVQHGTPVAGYRVGGVRPTFPDLGTVWFPVENNRIVDCLIWNGTIWESVGCRLWTGERWIPLWAFDIVTLADLWDMSDDTVQAPITSEGGFWTWWQTQWLDFRTWLSANGTGGGGTGGGTVDETVFPTVPPDPDNPDDTGWSFLDLLVALKDGTWKIISGTVTVVFGGVAGIVSGVVSVGDYFDAYDEKSDDNIFGIVNYGGDDIWD